MTSLTATFAGTSSVIQISVQDTFLPGWPKVAPNDYITCIILLLVGIVRFTKIVPLSFFHR